MTDQKNLTIDIKLSIPRERLRDELITFYEQPVSPLLAKRIPAMFVEEGDCPSETFAHTILGGLGWTVIDRDEDPEVSHQIDLEKISAALTKLAQDYPRHFSDFMRGQSDCVTADIIMQLAVLGEIVYG